jgi:tripartite-type tricarboxylate transporter receptor subunit TctC
MSLSKLSRLAPVLLLAAVATASAQEYPTRQVVMVIPFAAGGPTDTVGRHIAQLMTKNLKQQVIVENTAGAGGTVASNKVAKAKADGYTILLHHIGMSTAPALYRQLPFNPLTDFEYVGQVADVPMTLIAGKKLAANNFKEFMAYLKANHVKMTYGNAGLGAASHLCGLLFMTAVSTDVQTVSYKGTAPAMTDLIGGQIDFMCDQTTNTTGHIQQGLVKAYGVTSAKRVASLPNIPTLQEQGLKDFEVVVWHGIYAPRGTPKPALDKLNAALKAAVTDPSFKEAMEKLGSNPVPADKVTPEALQRHLKAEIAKWTPIIQKAGQFAD